MPRHPLRTCRTGQRSAQPVTAQRSGTTSIASWVRTLTVGPQTVLRSFPPPTTDSASPGLASPLRTQPAPGSRLHCGLGQPRARVSPALPPVTHRRRRPVAAAGVRDGLTGRGPATPLSHTDAGGCVGAGRADRSGTGHAPSKGLRDAVTHWRPPLDIQVGDRPRTVQGFKGLAVRVSDGHPARRPSRRDQPVPPRRHGRGSMARPAAATRHAGEAKGRPQRR